MKKEFVIKSIDSAPDGAPYVVLSLSSLKDLKEGTQNPPAAFGSPKVMGFSNMNDMMKENNMDGYEKVNNTTKKKLSRYLNIMKIL